MPAMAGVKSSIERTSPVRSNRVGERSRKVECACEVYCLRTRMVEPILDSLNSDRSWCFPTSRSFDEDLDEKSHARLFHTLAAATSSHHVLATAAKALGDVGDSKQRGFTRRRRLRFDAGMIRSKSRSTSGLSLGCRVVPNPCRACFSSKSTIVQSSSSSWSSDPFALAGNDHRRGKATPCRRRASGGTRSGYAPGYYNMKPLKRGDKRSKMQDTCSL
ncbi:hypothetical protein AKJ16_DCAP18806 [Drosera capensis]